MLIEVFLAVGKALAIIVAVAGPIAVFGAWAAGDRPASSVLPRAALVRRRAQRPS